MGQQLAMTPQLQQAIKLLQLSTLELQTEIQDALENNPMLEVQEEEGSDSRSEEALKPKSKNETKKKRKKKNQHPTWMQPPWSSRLKTVA